MIDVENQIFDLVSTTLTEKYPNITLYNEVTLNPASFPCVFLEMADCYSDKFTMDSSAVENFSTLVFEVNVYSNKYTGRKVECKSIIADIDALFLKMGFVRTTCQPISLDGSTKYRYATTSSKNNTITRMFVRYEGVISKDYKIYRR